MLTRICLLTLLLPLLIISCKEKTASSKIVVTGELKNIDSMRTQFPGIFDKDSIKISLYEVPFGTDAQPILLTSANVSARQTKFSLQADATKQGLYEVGVDKGPMIPVINDNDIHIDIDLLQKEKYYSVTGSPASLSLRDFIFGYSEKSIPASNAFKTLDSLKMTNSNDSAVIHATETKNTALEQLNNFVKQSVEKFDNPLLAAFTLGTASRTFSAEEYDALLNKTIARFPADVNLQYLKNQLSSMQQQPSQTQDDTWVGKPAPDMSMPDTGGKEVSLASFRGKYVLVDFWASWCGPCRMENPNVVRAYNTFKNRNFTVVGVSLDKEKDNWLEAIKKDNLTWTHISDLAFWDSKSVGIFKFRGIPFNVLINPEGIIIAESLRGSDLMNKLQQELSGK